MALDPPGFGVSGFCFFFFSLLLVLVFLVVVLYLSLLLSCIASCLFWISPHLALNPPYFVFFWCFCCLFFICFSIGKPVFPPKKAIFVYLSVFPLVSL